MSDEFAIFHYDGDMTYRQQLLGEIMVEGKMPETSLTELDPKTLNPMHREMNRGMMVAWINRQGAYHCDVRKSYVYYDKDKDFVHASSIPLGGPGAEAAFKRLGIKFWSVGV